MGRHGAQPEISGCLALAGQSACPAIKLGPKRNMTGSALLERTRNLLAARPKELSLKAVAEATGLSKKWLEDFLACRSPDPGVVKVEALYTFLAGQPLFQGEK